ncbi:aminodeoxychorismate synthase component I [Alterisphingorhabdus coralli]|uniref:Probable branched-chain-amino-acid aminotransferase n=1 Tax=Alterisphingorhabdus coralli TaxID=3071408 RepID=A0AA97F7I3_9SPHN|nr:aminodeoxychorismate synthase component I [Parasphingorhabdus sp. SCSIO 66989]WOE75611.1 aminodeoxychorismate synthase component I [Parasphingorhabdus sp. SCSIO 66989]
MADNDIFVLLDDASGQQAARLYQHPVDQIIADRHSEVLPALNRLETARNDGLHAAGYLSYEAGLALEPKLAERAEARATSSNAPLLWFGLFKDYHTLQPEAVDGWLAERRNSNGDTRTGAFALNDSHDDYASAFGQLQQAISAGDIYQANLTSRAHAHFAGDPVALYRRLRGPSAARYAALIHRADDWFLSLSPELFFTCHQGRLTARPMKGTLPAFPDQIGDAEKARRHFAADAKNRAENLMIVDLLRNDLSRIAKPGSVHVPDLFAVEHYPTVHQMVSTVRAELAEGAGISDILQAIYPCGSITGAPKIRAMELIDDVEPEPRGIYCGAIGRIDAATSPQETPSAAFNVAIRTLHFSHSQQKVTLGLGSGIVADSDRAEERQECLDKGAFAMTAARTVDLIETMALDPAAGIPRLEAHLARMKASAEQMAYSFDRHATRNAIQAACFHIDQPSRVRLMVSRLGNIAIDIAPLGPLQGDDAALPVMIQPLPVQADDPRLRHKTSDRAFYDDTRQNAAAENGVAEVIFTDSQGFITEGSFTHVFVERDGMLITPPLDRGVLPGILRAEMLAQGRALESDISASDLNNGFFLGNSVRGLLAAKLVA